MKRASGVSPRVPGSAGSEGSCVFNFRGAACLGSKKALPARSPPRHGENPLSTPSTLETLHISQTEGVKLIISLL